jgi:hypothetical protein
MGFNSALKGLMTDSILRSNQLHGHQEVENNYLINYYAYRDRSKIRWTLSVFGVHGDAVG